MSQCVHLCRAWSLRELPPLGHYDRAGDTEDLKGEEETDGFDLSHSWPQLPLESRRKFARHRTTVKSLLLIGLP